MKISVSKKRAERKRQKQSRKIQKINNRRKKKKNLKRSPLTIQQKKVRIGKLKNRKKIKQHNKKSKHEKLESMSIKNLQKAIFSVFNEDTLDKLAKSTGFIKRTGLITALSKFWFLWKWEYCPNLSCVYIR